MTKQAEWVNPNKQLVTSGHRAFDQQTAAICAGQVLSGTQYCHVVRAATELWNMNYGPKEPGHFQKWDLDHFPGGVPSSLREEVRALTASESLFLHVFFSYSGQRKTIHGWVAVRYEGDKKTLLKRWDTGPTYRSRRVLDFAIPFISDQENT